MEQLERYPVLTPPAHKKVDWNDARVSLLLPERARSECARSTAAVRLTRASFQVGKCVRWMLIVGVTLAALPLSYLPLVYQNNQLGTQGLKN